MKNMESRSKKKTSNSNATTYTMENLYKFDTAYCNCIYLVEESILKRKNSDEWKQSQESHDRLWDINDKIELKLRIGDYEGLQFPIVYREPQDDEGKRLRDVIWCEGLCYLISDRTKILLEENNVTGWKTYPVIVYDKRGNEIKGYHGFSITGHCGGEFTFCQDKEIQIDEYSVGKQGISIDLEQWDGSDIFTVSERGVYKVVTQRVYNLFKKNKIDAISMIALSKYVHDQRMVNNMKIVDFMKMSQSKVLTSYEIDKKGSSEVCRPGYSAVCRKDWGLLQVSFERYSSGIVRGVSYTYIAPIFRARIDSLRNWLAPFCEKMNLTEAFEKTWTVEMMNADYVKRENLSNLYPGYSEKDFDGSDLKKIIVFGRERLESLQDLWQVYEFGNARFLNDILPLELMDETKILAYLTLARILKPHCYEEEKAQILEKWNASQKEYAPEDLLNLCLKEHREELIRTMEATEFESSEVLV